MGQQAASTSLLFEVVKHTSEQKAHRLSQEMTAANEEHILPL